MLAHCEFSKTVCVLVREDLDYLVLSLSIVIRTNMS